jgi:L-2-hydroxyglutarate oxidase LhgO
VGAGVIGLAVAAQVAGPGRTVLLLERNPAFGRETSSRHSGIIHAGIYYPRGTLKATLCVRGRRLLYEICERHSVPHKRLGKLVVAVEEEEMGRLESLLARGRENGVEGLRLLSRREVKTVEPNVEAMAALLSPETGIIDDHALMRLFLRWAREKGAIVAFHKEVIDIERRNGGYRVTVKEPEGCFSFTTQVLINCAGLGSDRIAEMSGIDVDRLGYRLHYCLGEYFQLTAGRAVQCPIYPLPEAAGLGIHITPDLEGRLRLGPNVRYVDRIDYQVDPSQKDAFFQAARRYLPWVQYDDLEPEFAGIRPKLQGPQEGFRDFVISHEADKGFPGLINLIGIESPGLTSSPAIGEMVAGMVRDLL